MNPPVAPPASREWRAGRERKRIWNSESSFSFSKKFQPFFSHILCFGILHLKSPKWVRLFCLQRLPRRVGNGELVEKEKEFRFLILLFFSFSKNNFNSFFSYSFLVILHLQSPK